VILAFKKHMNKILEIDIQNLLAVVQLGCINIDLQKAAAARGLFIHPILQARIIPC